METWIMSSIKYGLLLIFAVVIGAKTIQFMLVMKKKIRGLKGDKNEFDKWLE